MVAVAGAPVDRDDSIHVQPQLANLVAELLRVLASGRRFSGVLLRSEWQLERAHGAASCRRCCFRFSSHARGARRPALACPCPLNVCATVDTPATNGAKIIHRIFIEAVPERGVPLWITVQTEKLELIPEETDQMATIGLYYPYIQFKDEAWLKLTALYWDQMARIVPKHFPLEDSDGVKMLVGDADYVFERSPKEEELVAVANDFEVLIKRHGDKLAQRYSVVHKKSWPDDPVTVATEPGADRRLAYVYPTKMAETLRSELTHARLAEYGPSRPDVGLGMHPRLADVYMLALARRVAKDTGFQPVTDETRNHIAVAACTVDELVEALLKPVEVARAFDRPAQAETMLLNMAFAAVIPENLKEIPMKTIVDVRKSLQDERTRFQEGLKEIVKNLGATVDVRDADAFARHIAVEYETSIERPLAELKKELERNKVKTTVGAFSLATALPGGTLAATVLAGAAPLLLGSVALALGVYTLVSSHREKTRDLMKSNLAYLVRLEDHLAPARLGTWVQSDLQNFTLDQRV